MIEPSFIDCMDFDIGGDFFDHIDDLLDFPSEDVDGGVVAGECNAFQDISPAPPPDMLTGSTDGFTGSSNNSSSELPTELSVPQEDIAQLEWLSNFVEDSFSAGSITLDQDDPIYHHQYNTTSNTITTTNNTITTTTTTTTTNSNSNSNSNIMNSANRNNKNFNQFRTSSPVSVLESSSSSSGGKSTLLGPDTVIPGRARSKRPRPATFNPRPVLPLISPTSSITDPTPQFSSELASEIAESHPANKMVNLTGSEEKKKKKRFPSWTEHCHSAQQPMVVRKCLHCEITKTPQWRAGPLGPKTLCNACGVRYKSGRLFPEYRPAASPTFITALHSNSHKKVLEMRVKDQKMTSGGSSSSMTPPPEFLPRSNYFIDYI